MGNVRKVWRRAVGVSSKEERESWMESREMELDCRPAPLRSAGS